MVKLRTLYENLGLERPQTYVQSGNVVFGLKESSISVRRLQALGRAIEDALENEFGFRPAMILRTLPEWRSVVHSNPFADRPEVTGAKLGVTFYQSLPEVSAREAVLSISAHPEELRVVGREVYISFPNGMGKSRLPFAKIDRLMKVPGTTRNWNSVLNLLEMAEALSAEKSA